MPASESALPLLRSALRRLYDASALRSSPLVAAFGLADKPDPAAALRQHLIRAIRALQPEPDMPTDTQAWRVYEILLYRYVQRSGQLEVAEQLGMSTRHLTRLERVALGVLADCLGLGATGEVAPAGAPQTPRDAAAIEDEVTWLGVSPPQETVNLADVLPTVLELAQPMAQRYGVTLTQEPWREGPLLLAVHPVALRQILLSLLSAAIRRGPGTSVAMGARRQGWRARVEVRQAGGPREAATAGGEADLQASLGLARRLTEAYGGSVEEGDGAQPTVVAVTLPALEQLPILAIDDNANTLQLMQRYISNTRYYLRGAPSLGDGLVLAQETAPRIIVLDVMMPDMDGWEALGRLRQHPLTAHVPVIICTILAEEELALSLGASGFLRKPFSREGFLLALDQLAGPAEPEAG